MKNNIAKYFFTASLFMVSCLSGSAATLEEAKTLFSDGDFQAALPTFKALLEAKPADATLNYYTGVCLAETGDYKSAMPLLEVARRKGVLDAPRALADISLQRYDLEHAETYIEEYNKLLSKNKKASRDDYEDLQSRLVITRNMLDRVEKITVIDSINVDADKFFKFYKLSKEAGSLNSATSLPKNYAYAEPGVVYMPENKQVMLWSAPDSTDTYVLMNAPILDDGSIDTPSPLKGDLNEGGDANFPFLMPDGVTLYFANDGENSLGGYDIFMTRRSDDGYLQPQNVGMPYNSVFNDYMLAIDEVTGLGWWATERNCIPGKVTIYVFIPNAVRENIPADEPDIASKALLTSIKATQTPGTDYSAMLAKLDELQSDNDSGSKSEFYFALPGGKIYTSLEQFSDSNAREKMEEYISISNEIKETKENLAKMREQYALGNRDVANDILASERSLKTLRSRLLQASNAVVRLEK
jgi:hypothetical protein